MDKSSQSPPRGEGGRPRGRIRLDEVKLRHTSHWDLDCMSRDEMDRAFAAGRLRMKRDRQVWRRLLRALSPARLAPRDPGSRMILTGCCLLLAAAGVLLLLRAVAG